MTQHRLSPNQMFLLHALLLKDYNLLNQFLHPPGLPPRKLPPGEMEELFDRGFLLDLNPVSDPSRRSYYSELFHVTELFTDLLKDKMTVEQARALWDAYPDWIPGKTYNLPAKTISHPLFDINDLLSQYLTRIGHSVEKHNQILAMLEQAKPLGYITMGIQKWITSSQWEVLERVFKTPGTDYGSNFL